MRAVIIAGGWLSEPNYARSLIQTEDLLIAADGGADHFLALGLIPNILVGDLDSITPETLQQLESAGVEIIRYDPHKDYTDLELALLLAQDRHCGQALVLGATGSRWDQTIASLLLPASQNLQALDVLLVDGYQELRLLRGGSSLEFIGQPGNRVSLVPICNTAEGITTQGLEYPLVDEDLLLGATRGVSNVMLGERARVHLRHGMLLCVILRRDPD